MCSPKRDRERNRKSSVLQYIAVSESIVVYTPFAWFRIIIADRFAVVVSFGYVACRRPAVCG